MPSSAQKSPKDEDSDECGQPKRRVGKACDRCRMKKSKCDGKSPCNRCIVDNCVCMFGERRKQNDRVFPKGYAEMLEHDRDRLIKAVRSTYQALKDAGAWPGEPLEDGPDGYPLTHRILEALGALKLNDKDELRPFDDDTTGMFDECKAKEDAMIARQKEKASTPVSRSNSFESLDHSRRPSHTFQPMQPTHPVYGQMQGVPAAMLTPQESPMKLEDETSNYFDHATDTALNFRDPTPSAQEAIDQYFPSTLESPIMSTGMGSGMSVAPSDVPVSALYPFNEFYTAHEYGHLQPQLQSQSQPQPQIYYNTMGPQGLPPEAFVNPVGLEYFPPTPQHGQGMMRY